MAITNPVVNKIFDDLDTWLNHCRENLIKYDPADLYRSKEYKEWQRTQEYLQRKARREAKGNTGGNTNRRNDRSANNTR